MATSNNDEPLKITAEDLARVEVPEASSPIGPAGMTPSGAKSYGTISDAAEKAPEVAEQKGSILLQGWFYLGAAGLLGATLGWGICERGFVDGAEQHWGNFLLLPAIVTFMCIGYGVAESAVERSVRKAILRGLLALPLGLVLGFIFYFVANLIYNIALGVCAAAGVQSFRNPAVWLARGLGWAVFGAAGGTVYGIVGQSLKKAQYGIIGGLIGAGVGGMIFDPIIMAVHRAGLSRAVGCALFGAATGVAMGWVESALKDRWLYVTSGPLAGKQFILYKAMTVIGSEQKSDIYLFKDPNVLGQHAVIGISGSRVQLKALGTSYVMGSPVTTRVLKDGDLLQIGRYAFRYKERHRS